MTGRAPRPWRKTSRPYWLALAVVVGIAQWLLFAFGATSLGMALTLTAAMALNVTVLGPWSRR